MPYIIQLNDEHYYDGGKDRTKFDNLVRTLESHFLIDKPDPAAAAAVLPDFAGETKHVTRKIILSIRCKGLALDWINTKAANRNEWNGVAAAPANPAIPPQSFDALITEMRGVFFPAVLDTTRYKEWEALTQGRREFKDFLVELRTKAFQLNPAPDNATMLRRALTGMDPVLRARVEPTLNPGYTLADIEAKAIQIEDLESKARVAMVSRRAVAAAGQKRHAPYQAPAAAKKEYAAKKPLTAEDRAQLQAQNACFYCKEKDAKHTAQNCPRKIDKKPVPAHKLAIYGEGSPYTKIPDNGNRIKKERNVRNINETSDAEVSSDVEPEDEITTEGFDSVNNLEYYDDEDATSDVSSDTDGEVNCITLVTESSYQITTPFGCSVNKLAPKSVFDRLGLKDEDIDRSFTVKARVNNHHARALIDTGSCTTLISEAFANKHNLPLSRKARPKTFGQASSGSFTVTHEIVPSIKTAYGKWSHVPFGVAFMKGHDILLGRDFIKRTDLLKKYLVDDKSAGKSKLSPKDRLVMAVRGEEEAEVFERINKDLINQYSDVFGPLPNKIPPLDKNTPTHKVILIDPTKVSNCRAYPIPMRAVPQMRAIINRHIAAGRLIPSSSPWASPVFLKLKKDPLAEPRWLNDYRQINSNTIKDATTPPRADDILMYAMKGRYYGVCDLTDSFSQTRMDPESQKYLAISTMFGNYEGTVMPQGPCNSPATHQRRINHALQGLIGVIWFPYVDDILIFGAKTIDEHVKNVKTVLSRLRQHNFLANPKKSTLIATRVEILGHYLSQRGLEADDKKIDKILAWPVSKTKKNIQEFMGLVNYLRKFCKNLAEPARLLTRLTKKNVKFTWPESSARAFDEIKHTVQNLPILRNIDYDSTEPIWVITDASKSGIGGVLAQGHDWKTARPALFESTSYNDAQKSYATHEQELLAIVHCLRKWRNILLHTPFRIVTDHESLTMFMKQRDLTGRQARWMQTLADFDFTITWVKGKTNTVADALSRYPHDEVPHLCSVYQITDLAITDNLAKDFHKEYEKDPHFAMMLKNIKSLLSISIRGDQKLLYLNDRLCVPNVNTARETILHDAHDKVGHFGIDKTLDRLYREYYWKDMRTDVIQYLKSCDSCQRNKSNTTAPAGPLRTIPSLGPKLRDIHIDWVELSVSNGFNEAAIITDRSTNFVKIIPCKKTDTAHDFALRFYHQWFRHFGLPSRLTSDRDKLFIGHFWKAFSKLTGLDHRMSATSHPESDGKAERTNKTAVQILRTLSDDKHSTRADHITPTEFAINSSVSRSSKFSPFHLAYGFTPKHIPEKILPTNNTSAKETLDVQRSETSQRQCPPRPNPPS